MKIYLTFLRFGSSRTWQEHPKTQQVYMCILVVITIQTSFSVLEKDLSSNTACWQVWYKTIHGRITTKMKVAKHTPIVFCVGVPYMTREYSNVVSFTEQWTWWEQGNRTGITYTTMVSGNFYREENNILIDIWSPYLVKVQYMCAHFI